MINSKIRKILKPLIAMCSLPVLGLSITSCSIEINPDPDPGQCQITFLTNGGTIEGQTKPKVTSVTSGITWGEVVKPEVIWADGRKIDFWSLNKQPYSEVQSDYVIEEETTFIPIPQVVQVTVTFNYDEELGEHLISGSTTENINIGSMFGTVNDPIIQKDGFVFNGWSTQREGSRIGPTTIVDEALDVYPLWVAQGTENNQIIAHAEDGTDYNCDINSMCNPEAEDIILTPVEGGTSIYVDRKTEFDFPLTIGSGVQYIPNYFMFGCEAFNNDIEFESGSILDHIGSSFMGECISFNSRIDIPDGTKYLGENFMGDCTSFVGKIDDTWSFSFPTSVDFIGQDCLSRCTAFNTNVHIYETIGYLGCNMMFGCDSFISTLTNDLSLSKVVYETGAAWSTMDADAPMATTGFIVNGTHGADLIAAYPSGQVQSTGGWRKIRTE